MNTPRLPPVRLAHLASYLRDLIQDVQAQGKVAKITGNPVEVAAVALTSGSIAVAQAFWEDVTALSGHATKTLARPVIENMAARGAGFLINKLLGSRK